MTSSPYYVGLERSRKGEEGEEEKQQKDNRLGVGLSTNNRSTTYNIA